MQSPPEARALALQFQLEQSQWWPADRLLAQQLRQLQSLIDHAAATVPFYRECLKPFAGRRRDGLTLDRFRQIPLLTRNEIQDAGRDLVSQAPPADHGRPTPAKTSGSTGQPIEFLNTNLTGLMASALTMRGHLWHGRDLYAKNVTLRTPLGGRTTGRRYRWSPLPGAGPNIVVDQRLPVDEIFDRVMAEDPEYLQGHPFLILGLIQRSEEVGIRPAKLKQIRTFGEALDPWLRQKSLDVWGASMVDNYSAEECGTIAHQCPETLNLHVQSESVLVEVVDDDGKPCVPGKAGRVVVTALHNFASPLIREDLGDIGRLGASCSCGRGLPVLEEIMGRQRTFALRPDGDRVFPARLAGLFDLPAIRQWQLTQKALEEIEVKLVVTRPLSASEEGQIREAVIDRFGYEYRLPIVCVDEIPREANGKYQEFKSEILSDDFTSGQDGIIG